MDKMNIYINADCIISPLGFSTQENLAALCSYRSGLKRHEESGISDYPIMASIFDDNQLRLQIRAQKLDQSGMLTKMEQLVIMAIDDILGQSHIDITDKSTGIILATTKGNVEYIDVKNDSIDGRVHIWKTADRIGRHFNSANRPITVSNACISGVSALIVGKRMIENGTFSNVIVVGCDVLSHFITSGFRSFKSLSAKRCVPFDSARDGLNLGEAAGAVLLSTDFTEQSIQLSGGSISNDANHISGPSRTGYELNLAIRHAMQEAGVGKDDISFVDTHGTATVYNDEMESKAVNLAELQDLPVQSLKSYFGHTLGASGVIETIVCAHELKIGTLFGTMGFRNLGTPMPIKVSAEHQQLKMRHCVKTTSGFGGCNAAIVLSLPQYAKPVDCCPKANVRVLKTITITDSQVKLGTKNHVVLNAKTGEFASFIREAYKNLGDTNMKFYKMDNLCKLGYVAAGYLLQDFSFNAEEMGIILANSSGSLDTDMDHMRIIAEQGDALASPATFVYTLANVVLGEICIRYKIKGENTFFVSEGHETEKTTAYVQMAMAKENLHYCITGWCELFGTRYRAIFNLIENTDYKP